ncbi:hypothetical protein ES705_32153 [subsurface metagenome]
MRKLSVWQKHVRSEAKRTGKSGATLFRAASKTYKKAGSAKRSNPKRVSKTARKSKLFRSISGVGALEDIGVGAIGGMVFRAMAFGAYALPATRICQGLAGVAMDRRGKRHLVSGVIDFIDNWLLEMMGYGVSRIPSMSGPPSINSLLTPLKALKIMR